MPYRVTPFVNQHYYHIYNRGVEKREIYSEEKDYNSFLEMICYYQRSGPKPSFSQQKRFQKKNYTDNPKIVEIVCYNLMPNHFHFILYQLVDNGISEFMSKLLNSQTKHYNTKYARIGPLFQGSFKAKLIETDEQLIHVNRYVHLNDYVAGLSDKPENYPYSSFKEYINQSPNKICFRGPVMSHFSSLEQYKDFISDQESYALELSRTKHLLVDGE